MIDCRRDIPRVLSLGLGFEHRIGIPDNNGRRSLGACADGQVQAVEGTKLEFCDQELRVGAEKLSR